VERKEKVGKWDCPPIITYPENTTSMQKGEREAEREVYMGQGGKRKQNESYTRLKSMKRR